MTASCFLIKPQRAADLDTAEVRRALKLFADPEHGIQLHAAPSWRFKTFDGDDLDGMTEWVRGNADATGIYYSINPVPRGLKTDLLSSDVLKRRWLFFDVDRVKTPENKEFSATDAEKAGALKLSAEIRAALIGELWPDPVIVDSGNGIHLLFRIDLLNDDPTRDLIRDVLMAVALRYGGVPGPVGRECHDARRVAKLPGTWARRGKELKDRPHRLTRLIFDPSPARVVPIELLRKVAAWKPAEAEKREPPKKPSRDPFVMKNGAAGHDNGYAKAVLDGECEKMARWPAGDLNNQIFRSGAACGNFVGSGELSEDEVFDALTDAAKKAGCDNPRKDEDTLRRAIRTGKTTPRSTPEDGGQTAEKKQKDETDEDTISVVMNGEVVAENTVDHFAKLAKSGRKPGPKVYELLTVGEIIARDLPEPNWAIPGLLSEGLNLLAGSPKMGKSMLSLNLGLTIAGGGKALEDIQTAPGDVLYLSLEDKLRRVKSRAVKMLRRVGRGDVNKRLTITTEWPRMDRGGLVLVREWIRRVERPTLLIVDVLGRFRTPSRDRGNQYEQDNEALYGIKQFVDGEGFSALVVTHTRKQRGDDKEGDPFEGISGTQGISGACDGLLLFRRQRQSKEATVEITGRDGGERKLALEFDEESFSWRSLGTAEEHLTGKLQTAIVAYMRGSAGRTIFLTELTTSLGEENPKKLRVVLNRLCDRGIVRRQGSGFVYPGPQETGDVEILS